MNDEKPESTTSSNVQRGDASTEVERWLDIQHESKKKILVGALIAAPLLWMLLVEAERIGNGKLVVVLAIGAVVGLSRLVDGLVAYVQATRALND